MLVKKNEMDYDWDELSLISMFHCSYSYNKIFDKLL